MKINITTKKLVLCGIMFLSALFTLLALAFPLIQGNGALEALDIKYSGFNLLKAENNFEILSKASITSLSASVYFYIQLLAAIALIIIAIVSLVIDNEKLSKILGLVCVISGVALTFIYMLWGTTFTNFANYYIGVSAPAIDDKFSTLGFLPFMFNMLFLIGYFVAKFYFKNKESGSNAQPVAAEAQPVADETQSVSE